MAASSSSSSGGSFKYDVFINFRGEDTRSSFVCHLDYALKRTVLDTFIDSEKLQKGDDLSKLYKAIQDSRLSILVFSKHYATSTWCLKELVQILECMDRQNKIVVPIFYQVDPSHVRKLKESFAEAFAKHESDSNLDKEELESWKSSLTRAANLSGYHSKDYRDDIQLIKSIVEDILKKVIRISPSCKTDDLIGMDTHMNKIDSLFKSGVDDCRNVVGIWGMGGIGKSTIARAVYDNISPQFEHKCFLDNVKEGFTKKGARQMVEDLLCATLNLKDGRTLVGGVNMIKERQGKKKVLLVLDDVDAMEQIDTLIGENPSFGDGSRIIITTRNKKLLDGFFDYKPEILATDEALELFRRYAFRAIKFSESYDEISKRAVKYAHGLPLAFKVLGGLLDNRKLGEWEYELKKIKKISITFVDDNKIGRVLRASYDGLDECQKNIFLDIACFFRGKRTEEVTPFHESCGFFPETGLRVLEERSLVTVSGYGHLDMHDLIQEMGREIVRQESTKDPGRRSRLWYYEDVLLVLAQNTPAEAVEGISLDLSELTKLSVNYEAFVGMKRLKLLQLTNNWFSTKQNVNGDLKFLSNELRVLVWHGCPLKSLPSDFQPKNLIKIDMPRSRIEQLWEGTKPLPDLVHMDLSGSTDLIKTPDLTEATNLKRLNLKGCTSLLEVHPSISALESLVLLNLCECRELRSLPSSIHMKSLEELHLYGCSKLEEFPEISEVMERLHMLDFYGTAVKELPSSINNLTGLASLSMRNCTSLVSLPSSIHMKSLEKLDLSGCLKLEEFPEISEVMERLDKLDLYRTAVKELPSSINNLTGLVSLRMRNCTSLVSLPSSIHMKSLEELDLSGCSKLEEFPEISEVMERLDMLDLDGTAVKELPSSINNLTGLVSLSMRNCTSLVSLPSSIHMKSLRYLYLSGCSNLEEFPKISEVMEKLHWLDLDGTAVKELPSSINNLTGLVSLSMRNCTSLVSLPSNIQMKSLRYLYLSGCSKLEEFPEISEVMETLDELNLDGTAVKELPSSINNLTGFVSLSMRNCTSLVSLPSSIHMKSLRKLYLSGCSKLEEFPEISEVMETLDELDLDGTAVKELPSSINNFTGLVSLSMRNCTSLVSLPSSIHMKSLEKLDLSGCSKLEEFPEISEVMERLDKLDLYGTAVKELPSSINNLTGLVSLRMRNCTSLVSLPSSIHMKSLEELDLSGCSKLEEFPEISEVMERLDMLDLDGTAVKELPSSINNLTGLVSLSMRNCTSLVSLPSSIHMKSLRKLYLSVCSKLEEFPEISEVMERLHMLDLYGTAVKELPSSINNLTGLVSLSMRNCTSLVSLPSSIHMKSLEKLDLSGCSKLEEFPEISEVMERLDKLDLYGTAVKELPSSINNLTGLVSLSMRNCTSLVSLPSSIHMKSLRYLYLSGCSKLEEFPKISEVMEKLHWLDLDGTAVKELPSSINNLTGLVSLSMRNCTSLVSLPSSIHMKSLRYLYLSGCSKLEEFPEISEVMVTLDELNLDGTAVKELPSSINNLTGFVSLSMRNCTSLVSLPSSIHMKSLRKLYLSGCSKLEEFPEISEVMETLDELDLDGTAVKELPSSINNLTGLVSLSMRNCTSLVSLPSNIHMKSLRYLYLSGCSKLEEFPEISEVMEKLHWLDLDGTAVKELPSSINNLTGLVSLSMRNCTSLVSLPSSIHMKSLEDLDLSGCSKLEEFPEISEVMKRLYKLDLDGTAVKELPSSINNLTGLVSLSMRNCTSLVSLPSSIHMKSLRYLFLSGCSKLEEFPEISEVMETLDELDLDGTAIKELPSSINNLTGLVSLSMRNCISLVSLPSSIHMKSLRYLYLSGCSKLEEFPEISEVMETLDELDLDETAVKELPSSINNLTGLVTLSMRNCTSLVSLPSSFHMKSLRYLYLSGCSKLEEFPEISEVMETLDELDLDETAVKELPSSINNLTGLVSLSMRNCTSLVSLPSSIHMKSLEDLDLSSCSKLEEFPEISEVMERLDMLDLDGTAVKELPSSINNLTGLRYLIMRNCTSLVSLPDEICNLACLQNLDLTGCSKLSKLPDNFQNWESLGKRTSWRSYSLDNLDNLEGSGMKHLPFCISRMKEFSCTGWKELTAPFSSWPTCMWNPRSSILVYLNLSGCNVLELSDAIAHLSSLRELILSGNNNLESLPEAMNRLGDLEKLYLRGCKGLKSIPELSSSIRRIAADDCTSLETVSTPQLPCVGSISFSFFNCLKLVNTNLFMCIVETAATDNQGEDLGSDYLMCLPGSDIPDWFNHQDRGSSVTVQLPPNWSHMSDGLAICAISNLRGADNEETLESAFCYATLKANQGQDNFYFRLLPRYQGGNDVPLESDHMILVFINSLNFETLHSGRKYTQATFRIVTTDSITDDPMTWKDCTWISSCGVRLFQMNAPSSVDLVCNVENRETEISSKRKRETLERGKEKMGVEVQKEEEECSGGPICSCFSLSGCTISLRKKQRQTEREAEGVAGLESEEADVSGEGGLLTLSL